MRRIARDSSAAGEARASPSGARYILEEFACYMLIYGISSKVSLYYEFFISLPKNASQGRIFSPAHGDTAFTVPLFAGFMKRIMPAI